MRSKYVLEKNSTSNFNTVICLLFVFVLMLLTSSQTFSTVPLISQAYSMVLYALFACFLLVVFLNNDSFSSIAKDVKFYCMIIYALCVFFHGLWLSGIGFSITQVMVVFRIFSPILLFHYFKQEKRDKYLKTFVKYSFIFLIGFSLFSIAFYYAVPGAARHSRENSFLVGGGYGLACAVSVLAVYLFGLLTSGFFKDDKKTKRIVALSIFIMSFTVYKTESTLTFLTLIISFACCFYFKKKSRRGYLFKMFLLPIVIVALVLLMPYIGNWLIDISKDKMADSRMYARIFSAGNLLAYGIDNTEALYSLNRFLIPFDTLKTFFNNPIIGVAYLHGNMTAGIRGAGVGNHCEFIDAFANFGVIGGIPFVTMYIVQIKEILKTKCSHPSFAWIINIVLLGLFNPLRYFHFNFVLFFFIPAFALLYERKNKRDKNNQKE